MSKQNANARKQDELPTFLGLGALWRLGPLDVR
jgi:hypothetical protein